MIVLVCASEDCAYNNGGMCRASVIDVRGNNAVSSSMTRCATFSPQNIALGDAEYGEEISFPARPLITCGAEKCAYNKSSKCNADKVEINNHVNSKMRYSECGTFFPH